MKATISTVALLGCLVLTNSAQGQAPSYGECMIRALFPAGGQRGQTVVVEFDGSPKAGLAGALGLLIDGPPGVKVVAVKNLTATRAQATLAIAADAPLGRRCLRLTSERSGVTNMLYFTVGRHPEVVEAEPNNEIAAAQAVTLPVVVNGRANPAVDVDCYRVSLKKGQHLVAAVLAHALDSHGQGSNYGITDANLELLDDRGQTLAEAGDTIGLDPLIEYTAPADGVFVVRVRLDSHKGYPEAVYRLTLSEGPFATSIFPPGGRRGSTIEVELAGPGFRGARQQVAVPADDPFPLQYVLPDDPRAADFELPFLRGDHPERIEVEPNQKPEQATPLDLPMTVNARIDAPGDVDWYRLRLTAGQTVCLETTAQRFLRSPVDTLLQVHDAGGKLLAENDDGFAIDYMSPHDYRSVDSRLVFTAPSAGDYFIQISDLSEGGGARAVYRLTVSSAVPDFDLLQFPDGVPIWGPGTTASLLVKLHRHFGLDSDIELSVEGLPEGWKASSVISRAPRPDNSFTGYYGSRYFLTLTAPANAKVGDACRFHVVGRTVHKGRALVRQAQPLTLYYSSDVGFFRMTPASHAVVAQVRTPWLTAEKSTLKVQSGATVEIPVRVHNADKLERIQLVVNLATAGVACAVDAPRTVPIRGGVALMSVKVPAEMPPGAWPVVVALGWGSDIRGGMPGPCTTPILLEIEARPAAK